MTDAVILMGGNLGDLENTFDKATAAIGQRVGKVLSQSRDHWTEPWGFEDDRPFLNKALLVHTPLRPLEVLQRLLVIEAELGRQRSPGSGYVARTIDLDILFYGDSVMDIPGLSLPHPQVALRTFALGPAADIVPDLIHPALKRSVMDLLNDLLKAG